MQQIPTPRGSPFAVIYTLTAVDKH